jgi:site-specific DNA recombinase
MKACGYLRVSCEEQKVKGVSLDNQESRIKSFCESQGWSLIKIFRDEGFSGKSLQRPGIQELIADAKLKKFDALAVYRIDRISRCQRDFLYLIEDVFEANKIIFKSITEPLDTGSPVGKAMLSIISTFAELERGVLRERIRDALDHKKQNGEWLGGIPYGYRIEGKNLAIDEDQARTVKLIFWQRMKGKSLREITEGILAKGINSRKWSIATVHNILKNPVYLGNGHPRIVGKRLFDKVQIGRR